MVLVDYIGIFLTYILSVRLWVCFIDRCLSFFFWPLCCLFFFDLWIMITPLVFLNSSSNTNFIIWGISISTMYLFDKSWQFWNTDYFASDTPRDFLKGVIIIHKSKKNRQHNGQKKKEKRTNNDLQNIHIKLKRQFWNTDYFASDTPRDFLYIGKVISNKNVDILISSARTCM
jgi:hypothetical protein